MADFSRVLKPETGVVPPARWGRLPTMCLAIGLVAFATSACGSKDEQRTIEPIQLGMTSDMGAIYQDDQMAIYEVKLPIDFGDLAGPGSHLSAVREPTADEKAAMNGQTVPAPYTHYPWLLKGDYTVQLTYTISNLDPYAHNVELLLDPHNEFGVYWPGMAVTDAQREQQSPNLSGYDNLMHIPANGRVHGTLTVQDMDELAIDFATVLNILQNAPPPDPTMNAADNPAVGLVNHAFARENRSYDDPLVAPYIPSVIAGLTGVDLGLRTYESANVAIEVVIEIVDKGSGKVIQREDVGKVPALTSQDTAYVTLG
jgi:hypothetical protein